MTFEIWDYVVFISMLIISAGIGVYFRFTGGKQKTTNEYLLADRNMSILPVSTSLMASFMSAITLLGVSMEVYQFGLIFIVINVSYGLATPIAAYLYLPVFFKLQATSAYEYLELRFGKETRILASLIYSLQMILYMGIVLYAPALALEALTGISKTGAILLIGIVCTFYSTIGGMKAVLITDVFQSLLMFAAVYVIIIVAGVKAGGLHVVWERALEGGRINFLNFDINPVERHTWWSLIIGGGFTYLTLYAVNQTQVQRLLTIKDLSSSQKALWLNWPILTMLSLSTSFSGLSIYYYYQNCDPLLEGRISSRDQLMPIFVVDAMKHLPGVAGLFVSGIFSASLSTVSATMNSLAAVTLEDYIKPVYLYLKQSPLPEITSSLPTKITAFLYGVICIAIAFTAQNLGGVLQASLTIFGIAGGPLLGLFTLGMFTIVANQRPVYLYLKQSPLPEITSSLPTKITAFLYGVICIAIAFTAQNLGGVLQASLTIFGIAGGPLLGLFTLGMFTIVANQRGSILGILCGLSICLVIGFGGPKPSPIMLIFSTDNCTSMEYATNTTDFASDLMSPLVQSAQKLVAQGSVKLASDYIWLYRLSYMWNVVIGFVVTFMVGYCVSWFLNKLNIAGECKIYTDCTKTFINTDLFTPPLAKRLKKQMAKYIETNGNFVDITFEVESSVKKTDSTKF